MKKRRFLIAAFLSIAILISSCSEGDGQPTPTPIPTPITIQKPTYQVQRGTVINLLRLQGRVSPVNQQDLFFRSDGYVRKVNFSSGDTVKTGDVLAELELGDLEIQLSQAQLALQKSEAILAQAEQDNANQLIDAYIELDKINLQAQQAGAPGISLSLEDAQVVVDRAQIALDAANEKYQKAQNDPGSTSDEINKYKEAFEQAQGNLYAAQKKLENSQTQQEYDQTLGQAQETLRAALHEYYDSLKDPDLMADGRDAIRQKLDLAKQDYVNTWMQYAEIISGPVGLSIDARIIAKDLAKARLRVEELKLGVNPLMYLDVEQSRLDLQTVQDQVERARLTAPFDGQILSQSLTPGSQVSAYLAVLTLADPSTLELIVHPSSQELSVMGIGQPATIEWMNRTGQTDSGTIRLMPYVGSDTGSDQVKDKAVHISLNDPGAAMTLGEAASAVIEVEKRENVLWLPPAALRIFQGRDFVFVEENGVQRRVDVLLGLSSADRVEILEGLSEGQTVLGP